MTSICRQELLRSQAVGFCFQGRRVMDVKVLKLPHLLGLQLHIPGLGRFLLFSSQNGKAEVRRSLNEGCAKRGQFSGAGRRKRETWRSGEGEESTLYHALHTRLAEQTSRVGGR